LIIRTQLSITDRCAAWCLIRGVTN